MSSANPRNCRFSLVIPAYNEERLLPALLQTITTARERGQKLTRLRSVKAVTSTRKFDTFGDWHYFTELYRLLPLILRSPGATNKIAERFWYGDQRPPDQASGPDRK